MSTWCAIAKIERDGSGRYILLTHDGYPDWAGIRLLRSYSEESEIDELLSLGDLSTLSDSPEAVVGAHAESFREQPHCGYITRSYRRDGAVKLSGDMSWKPRGVRGGTDEFFNFSAQETCAAWAYAWTPDGWIGCWVREYDLEDGLCGRPTPLAMLVEAGCGLNSCRCSGDAERACPFRIPLTPEESDGCG